MRRYDYLIIGGGIAGVTAAETIREHDHNGTIGIFTDEPHLLYSRVLLPSYLKKKISREKVFLRAQRDFEEKRIEFHTNAAVSSVHPEKKEVGFADSKKTSYKKLLIASGGRVKPWDNAEILDDFYRLQTLDDADRLFDALSWIREPLVMGGSFITLEFLEIFALHGVIPRLLVRDPHFFWPLIEERGAELLHENFKKQGIEVRCGDSILDIFQEQKRIHIRTHGGQNILCDSIAAGIGLERNCEFLRGSDIELGNRGIRTNEFFETNVPDVYAAGDVAEFYDGMADRRRAVGNWTNAFLQGKHAGLNMVGTHAPFTNISSYSITNFGFQISAVGDCNHEYETIVHVRKEKNEYERLFLWNKTLKGAFLINRFQERGRLMKMIEERSDVLAHVRKPLF